MKLRYQPGKDLGSSGSSRAPEQRFRQKDTPRSSLVPPGKKVPALCLVPAKDPFPEIFINSGRICHRNSESRLVFFPLPGILVAHSV